MKIDVHIHFHDEDDVRATRSLLEHLLAHGRELTVELKDIQARLDTLTQKVADETTLDDSLIALVSGLTQTVGELKTQLANAGTNPDEIQKVVDGLDALQTTIDSNAQKLTDAVVANTPVANQ